jgi:calcium-dependent protein kinase
MGCIVNKKPISIVAISPPRHRLSICNDTKVSRVSRNSITLDCSTFIREQEGSPSNYYETLTLLGKGSFGKVYKVKHKVSGQEYAMKVLKKDHAYYSEVNEQEILKEIKILKNLDHQNIIKIHEYFNTPKEIFIISELCKHGELYQKLVKENQIKEETVLKIMKQVFSAVSYCHSYNIMHRDLKPQNVLIWNDNNDILVKVIDFGTSEMFQKPLAPGCIGTVFYIAPEIANLQSYDQKCDLWSCGVMMYFLLSGEFPFPGNTEEEVFTKILKGKFTFSNPVWDTISDEAKNLITALLTKNPTRRLSAQQALEHPWIKNKLKKVTSKSVTDVFNHFNNFKVYELLQHAVLLHIVRNCKKTQEFLEVRRKFSLLDVNKDGKLSFDELVESFSTIMDREEANKCVAESFKLMDTDENGFIEFEEFMKVCLEKNTLLSENNLQNTFNLFDHNKNGLICINDLKTVLGNNNQNENDSLWMNLITHYDKDCDGMLSFDEFKDMMNQIKKM